MAINANDTQDRSLSFFLLQQRKRRAAADTVQHERFLAKFWLNPVALAGSRHFSSHALRTIQKHVDENQKIFMEAWGEHIGS